MSFLKAWCEYDQAAGAKHPERAFKGDRSDGIETPFGLINKRPIALGQSHRFQCALQATTLCLEMLSVRELRDVS
jgi:hypothetical protein